MFEKQSTFFKDRVIYLFIFGAIFFVLSFLRLSSPAEEVLVIKVVERSAVGVIEFTPVEFNASAYYRPIIENSLFRPLGWAPPRPIEPYRLIGTIFPHDGDTPPQAITETTAGKTTYIVSTGERLDPSTEVVSIEAKQVTLSTDGQKRTLRLPIRY